VVIQRFGNRSRVATRYIGDFSELLSGFTTKFVNLRPEITEILNGEVIDFGSPINLKTMDGFININSGPMANPQLMEFFPKYENLPDLAYYLDVDYWREPNKEMEFQELLEWTRKSTTRIWDIHEQIIEHLEKEQK